MSSSASGQAEAGNKYLLSIRLFLTALLDVALASSLQMARLSNKAFTVKKEMAK